MISDRMRLFRIDRQSKSKLPLEAADATDIPHRFPTTMFIRVRTDSFHGNIVNLDSNRLQSLYQNDTGSK